MATDPRLRAFGRAKRDSLPEACRACDVLAFCNGGCPKDRDASGLNRLCPAYRRFFRHAAPGLAELADHLKTGQPLRDFRIGQRPLKPGRG
jgi:uncharacterized protein